MPLPCVAIFSAFIFKEAITYGWLFRRSFP